MSNKIIAGTATGATTLPVASTIDGSLDYTPIYTASANATQAINRNTYLGLASAPVGLTDTQTLTNKTLTAPAVNNPVLGGTLTGTYVIGGTPTFPSSVVQLTSTQTLTNKTLTSPTINSPTITNATLSADTITGFTTSNSGTIYGISVTTGTIGSAAIANNAILNAAIATGNLYASKFYNPYKFRVYQATAGNLGGSPGKVIFDTKNYDTSSNFDVTTNHRFTAPVAGFYQFNWNVNHYVTAGNAIGADLYKNGSVASQGSHFIQATSNWNDNVGGSDLVQLAANDYVEIYLTGTVGNAINTGAAVTFFSGFLVSAT